jgi:hypothetical protein
MNPPPSQESRGMKTKEERKEEAYEEYLKIEQSAREELVKITEPVWETYWKIEQSALEDYKKTEPVWETYLKRKQAAFATYKQKYQEIDKE